MISLKTTFESRSVEETLEIGRGLGRDAIPGSIILLDGDLGTGKTVLARGIAQGLGIHGWRGSPTFNLVHEYVGRVPFYHIDAYRIDVTELLDLDFDCMMGASGVVAIEWGAKMAPAFQPYTPASLILAHLFDGGGEIRHIEVSR